MVYNDRFIKRRIVVQNLPGRPWPFPIDMLRYDSCLPASEEDAHLIERLMNPDFLDNAERFAPPFRVTLYRFARLDDEPVGPTTGRLHKNSHDRWRTKYHWEIVEDELDGY